MTKLIAIAFLALLASTAAEAASPKGCRANGTCAPRDTSAIKACGVKWKEAKASDEVRAKGWPAFWSACAKEAKAARTVAP